MMDKIIKVLPAEGCNPEFAPDREAQEGTECKGYLLLCFGDDEKLSSVHMCDCSVKMIADAIWDNTDDTIISCIRQACAVAEGYIRAADIYKGIKFDVAKKNLLEMLAGSEADLFGEEEDEE